MTKESNNKERNDTARTQIIVGLLGFLGVVVTAILTIYAPIIQDSIRQRNQPTQPPVIVITATSGPTLTPVPTDTVPPGADTSTPAPVTDTPVPTETFTPIPAVPIGQDWPAGCISNLWKPYPANVVTLDNGNGCWQEPLHVFSADNGSLQFLYERKTGLAEVYGLFAPLPESGTVTFKVRLEDLSNVDFVMGIFSATDIYQPALIMTVPAGNVKQRLIVIKGDMANYETVDSTIRLDQGDGFSFTFTFNNLSASGTVNPNVFVSNPISLPGAQKYLFIGYKGLSGTYRIEGAVTGLEIK